MIRRRHKSTQPKLALALLAVLCHLLQLSHFVVVAHEDGECGGHPSAAVHAHGAGLACAVAEPGPGEASGADCGGVGGERSAPSASQDDHHCLFQQPSLDSCGGEPASPRAIQAYVPGLALAIDSWRPAASRYALAPKQSPPVLG